MNRLFRSRKDRVFAGVCSGIGNYFNIDAAIIRLIFIIFVLLGFGGGFLAYLILWITVPEEPIL